MPPDIFDRVRFGIRVLVLAQAAAFFGGGVAVGCGGASAEVRTAYAIEQARCLANERAIIDRGGTTEEEDRADFAAERVRCDAALRSIYGGTP